MNIRGGGRCKQREKTISGKVGADGYRNCDQIHQNVIGGRGALSGACAGTRAGHEGQHSTNRHIQSGNRTNAWRTR